ncbi:MAG: NAD(P)-dependent oxidoreductase [Candidatus Sericytochromatia bacterium]|nr:NAD(P)-dependent oxidoreductase [Candidatus Sericytochromatia bacterium]
MSVERQTVLVTGASGTVGGFTVPELVAKGYHVVAVDRPGAKFDWELPANAPVVIRLGDLTDPAFCREAVEGVNSIIHLAGAIDLRLSWEQLSAINVDAVRYLYEAARETGCRRFVFFSSGSIYRHGRTPSTESTPFAPASAYERSKVAAEQYLWGQPRSGPEVVVVRPSMIYGPRARFLGAKAAALPPMLALLFPRLPRLRGGASVNWIHAEDAARAAVFLLEPKQAAWEAFNVADDTPTSVGELLDVVTEAYGLPQGPALPYPTALVNAVVPLLARSSFALSVISKATEGLWRHIVGREGLQPAISAGFDKELLDYATQQVVFDNSKLKRLGFTLKFRSLREGYPSVLRWFQANRWVPVYRSEASREWGGSVGFTFAETMAGTWWSQTSQPPAKSLAGTVKGSGGVHPFRFSVTVRSASARDFLRTGALTLEGLVDADGLAARQPCTGTLTIKAGWRPELVYDVRFTGDDGQPYRFEGKKQISLLRFLPTISYLPGRLADPQGQLVGRAITYFDLENDLKAFLGSFSVQTGAKAASPSTAPVVIPVTIIANSDVGLSRN